MGFAQSIKDLKLRDTIYIFINFDKKQKIEFNLHSNGQREDYTYRHNDSIYIGFITNNKKFTADVNFKTTYRNIKNKKNIFRLQDFVNYNLAKTVYDLDLKKIKCFIIDKNDCYKREVFIKTAGLMNRIKYDQ